MNATDTTLIITCLDQPLVGGRTDINCYPIQLNQYSEENAGIRRNDPTNTFKSYGRSIAVYDQKGRVSYTDTESVTNRIAYLPNDQDDEDKPCYG